jgi:hypothetical protein
MKQSTKICICYRGDIAHPQIAHLFWQTALSGIADPEP